MFRCSFAYLKRIKEAQVRHLVSLGWAGWSKPGCVAWCSNHAVCAGAGHLTRCMLCQDGALMTTQVTLGWLAC